MNEETTVLQENEFTKGRIIKSTGGLYSVEAFDNDGRIYECRAKGAFRREKVTPLTGDIVKFLQCRMKPPDLLLKYAKGKIPS